MEGANLFTLAWHEYGDAGLLVDVDGDDYEGRWWVAQSIGHALLEHPPHGFVDVVASYHNVYVTFDPLVSDHQSVQAAVERVAAAAAPTTPRRFIVPVVYGGDHGPDLGSVADELGTTSEAVIAHHLSDDWVVRFVASPVGAPMMDGPRLPASVGRLVNPRARVAPGAVALSGFQSMIYNAASPGGWRVIGRTPLRLFDLDEPPHVGYRPGDLMRFRRIEPNAWDQWAGQWIGDQVLPQSVEGPA